LAQCRDIDVSTAAQIALEQRPGRCKQPHGVARGFQQHPECVANTLIVIDHGYDEAAGRVSRYLASGIHPGRID
jgi:hypothetical protein